MNWLVNQRVPVSCHMPMTSLKFSCPLAPFPLLTPPVASFFLFSLCLIRPFNHSRYSLIINYKYNNLHLVGIHKVPVSFGGPYGLVFEDNWLNKDAHVKGLGYTRAELPSFKKAPFQHSASFQWLEGNVLNLVYSFVLWGKEASCASGKHQWFQSATNHRGSNDYRSGSRKRKKKKTWRSKLRTHLCS